jgi:hypothetical protein
VSRASTAGHMDGSVRAWTKPDDFDPTGGFIRRVGLLESERAEYVTAYEIGFTTSLKSRRS